MKKTVLTLAVTATVGFGTIFTGYAAKTEAASFSELNGKINEIHEKKADVNSDIDKANDKIKSIQKQQSDVRVSLEQLEITINETTKKINDQNNKISETKTEIAKLQDDIKIIQERMQKRSLVLKDRARSYQENGGAVNYLDVLFGAESFSDFIDRANAVVTLVQADQAILKQQEADKKELQQKQDKVKNDLAGLETMLSDLKNMNQQLAAQKAEKNKLLKTLDSQKAAEEKNVMSLKEKEQILSSQENAINKAIELEKARQAEAKKKAQQAQIQSKSTASSGSTRSSGSAGTASSQPHVAVSSGAFTRPTIGPVTSGYGYRSYDHSFHNGIDFGSQTSSDPIVAVADGVVSRSYLSSSYGECVFISSIVNGQLYTSIYAHMASGSRSVHEGQVVKKGQRIGTKGATGAADGVHLHFELHKGKWEYDKRNKINPSGIIPGV
ncbi:murein hydrolase activator EnvC [Neobacillus mesonae]|uniref:murein hydrolase activator EnvC family protein n=1 Tax=Neobacillus mesonae TaxID=1193713 RepID=UPI00203A76C6|nr:M23 family metallopeptidase [Neobacillus mesonae]MCM3567412.1 peptidoglycan DD-metalloendopeptidase family protein [Neobacillus mesonae]